MAQNAYETVSDDQIDWLAWERDNRNLQCDRVKINRALGTASLGSIFFSPKHSRPSSHVCVSLSTGSPAASTLDLLLNGSTTTFTLDSSILSLIPPITNGEVFGYRRANTVYTTVEPMLPQLLMNLDHLWLN